MASDQARATDRDHLATVLRDLAWTIHRFVPEAAGVEPLPTTELAVIKQILTTPGTTVTELANHLAMQHSNVSAAVRSLLNRGLVDRETCVVDRRRSKLVPTAKSLGAQESIDTVWSGTVRTAMTRLEPEQVRAVEAAAEALEALDGVLRTEKQPQRMRG